MRRTFLGLPVGADLATRIAALTEPSKGVRWIPSRNIHVTLEFLGESPDSQITALVSRLADIELSPVCLEATGLDCYPIRREPRVLAITLEPDADAQSLYTAVREAAGLVGFDLPKPRFSPHITIARLRRVDRGWLAGFLDEQSPIVGTWGAYLPEALVLYESTLTPEGAEYSAVASYPLPKRITGNDDA